MGLGTIYIGRRWTRGYVHGSSIHYCAAKPILPDISEFELLYRDGGSAYAQKLLILGKVMQES
jgi:hypothetical protein